MAVLNFVTLDVFTTSRYVGNQLAIVHVPARSELSLESKQLIATEFNLSETVFIHDLDGSTSVLGNEVQTSIFTPRRELPFAGHPTIGMGFHLLSNSAPTADTTADRSTTLITRAGKIPVTYSPETGLTRLQVPHAFAFHKSLSREYVGKAIGLSREDALEYIVPNDFEGADAVSVVSVVAGMPFALVQVASVEALGKTRGVGIIPASEFGMDGKPGAIYLYCMTPGSKEGVTPGQIAIRARMYFEGIIEDPATGSGASCLCGFLSMTKEGREKHSGEIEEYHITQGVEMGRKSEIRIDVKGKPPVSEGSKGEVDTMWLSGKAVQVMQGTLSI